MCNMVKKKLSEIFLFRIKIFRFVNVFDVQIQYLTWHHRTWYIIIV